MLHGGTVLTTMVKCMLQDPVCVLVLDSVLHVCAGVDHAVLRLANVWHAADACVRRVRPHPNLHGRPQETHSCTCCAPVTNLSGRDPSHVRCFRNPFGEQL